MNKGIIKEGVIGVLKLKWLSMFKNYRRRVKSNNTVSMDEYVSVQRK
ncbi:MAG: hypothetical protein ABIP35_02465 [Ginsengibacter sp.]